VVATTDMMIRITFKTPHVLPRAVWSKFRKGADDLRKRAPTTYVRTLRFTANREDLVNITMGAVHEVLDIARVFGVEGFEIVQFSGEICEEVS
jgi:hypothetical protein